MTSAETAYLFRHALLRDAARQLQPPAERGTLHDLARLVLTELFAGVDSLAAEIADHTRDARVLLGRDDLAPAEFALRRRAAIRARKDHMPEDELRQNRAIVELPLVPAADRALAYCLIGNLLLERGRLDEAMASAEAAIAESGRCDDADVALRALRCRAAILALGADPARALAAFEQVLRKAEGMAEKHPRALALNDMALHHKRMGDTTRAEELFRQSHALFPMPGPLTNLASLLQESGRPQEAEALCRQLMADCAAKGDLEHQALALLPLGNALRIMGRRDEARACFQQAADLAAARGQALRGCGALLNLAVVAHESGQPAQAEQMFLRCLELCRESGERRYEAVCLTNLGVVQFETGRAALAESNLHAALAAHRAIGNTRAVGNTLGVLGNIARLGGDLGKARTLLEEAIATHRRTRNRRFEGMDTGRLALLCAAEGDRPQAMELLREAESILSAVGDKDELAKLRAEATQAGLA